MGEGKKNYKDAIKNILRPDKGKIMIFIIFLLAMMILPLYPTHTNEYQGYSYDEAEWVLIESHTTLQPLSLVMYHNFKWNEIEPGPPGQMLPAMLLPDNINVHVANPIYLILYIPYFIIAYLAACFLTDFTRWNRKSRDEPEQIIEPLNPIKEI